MLSIEMFLLIQTTQVQSDRQPDAKRIISYI